MKAFLLFVVLAHTVLGSELKGSWSALSLDPYTTLPDKAWSVKLVFTPATTFSGGQLTVTGAGTSTWVGNASPITATTANAPVTIDLTMPATSQIGRHALDAKLSYVSDTLYESSILRIIVEVTCSDGNFCNGMERYVGGKCVSPTRRYCDDQVNCTIDTCDEDLKICKYEPTGADCASCSGSCVPDCASKACGENGCGGFCGTCTSSTVCQAGQCIVSSASGSCASPISLFPAGFNLDSCTPNCYFTITGDSTDFSHFLVPTCNTQTAAPEVIYSFDVPAGKTIGMEVRSYGTPDADGYSHDTVLEVRKDKCDQPADMVASDQRLLADVMGCSDDATPPGNFGSRLELSLPAGKYYLYKDGYSAVEVGPFEITVKITNNDCVPRCDGAVCGSDGCGGQCGACATGEECVSFEGRRCLPSPCVPSCTNRTCGYDGCTGTCGTCSEDEFCLFESGTCTDTLSQCDHFLPSCTPACGASQYCGSDCTCYSVDQDLPDLLIHKQQAIDELTVHTKYFGEASCALVETCVGGSGWRRLLSFTTTAVNQGFVDLGLPDPKDRPDLFIYGICHGHYHFPEFGDYELLKEDYTHVISSQKNGFCLEDSNQDSNMLGPRVACQGKYDCGTQGITGGWADSYGSSLDCQWIDITGIAPGNYLLRQFVNPNRFFHEATFDNNVLVIPVTIPALLPGDPLYVDDTSSSDEESPSHRAVPAALVVLGLMALSIF